MDPERNSPLAQRNAELALENARLLQEARLLERQRQYYESLVEFSPAAVVVMDHDERVTDWNPAATSLFGYSSAEAVGQLIDALVFDDARRDEGREITREAVAEGGVRRIGRRRRKDGTAVDVELMLVQIGRASCRERV